MDKAFKQLPTEVMMHAPCSIIGPLSLAINPVGYQKDVNKQYLVPNLNKYLKHFHR